MFNVSVENVGELAIVECQGRLVQSEAAFHFRDVVTSQAEARTVVVDLSEVTALEGWGLGMLMFLQRWAQDHDVRFKLFNPSLSLLNRLQKINSMSEFEIASLDEMMALLGRHEPHYNTWPAAS
ncbi:MAG TPA: STAS domain-containing protein [Terriglobales bacterium]|nr:STAS domain-containing protein [Terriglobales bacterium]